MSPHGIDKVISAVGSVSSLLIHTCLFASAFLLALFGVVEWSIMLLILTTVVSLEAIYLAIFIQMSVTRQAKDLESVSEDVEDIQEDIEEISHDVDEIQKDVDEIQEDVDEIQEDVEEIQEDVEEITEEPEIHNQSSQTVSIDELTSDLRKILANLERLQK